MEKNRICKICNRRFANGKAMGGHMRSHLARLPLPPKHIISSTSSPHHPSLKSPSLSSSSSLNYPLISTENPMQSYRSVNCELTNISKPNLAHDLHDGESETESPRSTIRRRSKRRRKSMEKVVVESPEQVSSISDIFNEEDVALCLLMLSRDNKRTKKPQVYDDEFMEVIEAEDEVEDEDKSFGEIRVRSKSNGKFKCETCKKRFRSYQALGGHKASHKKIKRDEYDGSRSGRRSGDGASGGDQFIDQRIFKCPFCDKVFESGQALGGHKKVHFSFLGSNAKLLPKSDSDDNLLDLNLPAPEDDGDDDGEGELSQVYQQRNW